MRKIILISMLIFSMTAITACGSKKAELSETVASVEPLETSDSEESESNSDEYEEPERHVKQLTYDEFFDSFDYFYTDTDLINMVDSSIYTDTTFAGKEPEGSELEEYQEKRRNVSERIYEAGKEELDNFNITADAIYKAPWLIDGTDESLNIKIPGMTGEGDERKYWFKKIIVQDAYDVLGGAEVIFAMENSYMDLTDKYME